jgi:hypothetical protein
VQREVFTELDGASFDLHESSADEMGRAMSALMSRSNLEALQWFALPTSQRSAESGALWWTRPRTEIRRTKLAATKLTVKRSDMAEAITTTSIPFATLPVAGYQGEFAAHCDFNSSICAFPIRTASSHYCLG